MSGKTKVRCTVTVTGSTASPNPDPVNVSRASNNGVQWVMATPGYRFTGVEISDWTDFQQPTFSDDHRTMTVEDSVADYGNYTYSIGFEATSTGERFQFDPTIHNQA